MEKNLKRNKRNNALGIGMSTESDDTMNEDTPVGVASAVKKGVTPSVVDITPSYANVTGKPNGKKLNIRTLFTRGGGNGIDVVVLVESIRAISKRFANTAYGFFLVKRLAYHVVSNYARNTWNAMLENGPWLIENNSLILKKWHPEENLLKEDVSIVPVWVKLHDVPVTAFSEDGLSAIATKLGTPLLLDSYGSDMCMEGHYICDVHVEYEWKPSRCASCKVFGHIHEECSKNTGAGEKKTVKKPSQTSQAVIERKVWNLLLSTGTTHIIDKIRKFEELLTSGQAILVDEAGNPLKEVEFSDDYDSEDEVASVDNDMARSMASEMVGFGTQSLLEQWRDSYGNGDYDDDPYDDDMYKVQDLSQ
nr:hypothetical protein [Tanacetum cinerariifolium]